MSEKPSETLTTQEPPKVEEVKSDADIFYGEKSGDPAAQPADAKAPAEAKPGETAKPAEEKKPDVEAKPDDSKKPEEKKAESKDEKPVVPEKYELALPKDSLLDPAAIEKISSYAKEKGFSNEQAQELLNRESDTVAAYHTNQVEEFTKLTNETWVEEARADKEIGGDKFAESAELAKRVVNRFATPEFKEILRQGYGNNPELLRIFARIGKAMADDQYVKGGASSSGAVAIEDVFYPQKS